MRRRGLVDVADIPFVPSWKIVEDHITEYGWKDDKEYYKKRLAYVYAGLNETYDPVLAREKQALYFINSVHINFMDEMGNPTDWARL